MTPWQKVCQAGKRACPVSMLSSRQHVYTCTRLVTSLVYISTAMISISKTWMYSSTMLVSIMHSLIGMVVRVELRPEGYCRVKRHFWRDRGQDIKLGTSCQLKGCRLKKLLPGSMAVIGWAAKTKQCGAHNSSLLCCLGSSLLRCTTCLSPLMTQHQAWLSTSLMSGCCHQPLTMSQVRKWQQCASCAQLVLELKCFVIARLHA